MALPTIEKTWNFGTSNAYVNQRYYTTNDYQADYQNWWWMIKQSLVGSGNWVVRSSSNSTTVSASDNWNAYANVRAAQTGAHSWIVLRNTAIGPNFDICIDLIADYFSGNPQYASTQFFVAPNGYATTGGTTSTRPATLVASDEIDLTPGWTVHAWGGTAAGVGQSFVLHVMQSSDGQCTRIATYAQDYLVSFILLDKAKTSHTSTQWPIPFVYMYLNAGATATNVGTVANTFTTAQVSSGTSTPTGHFGFGTRFASSGVTAIPLFGSCETYAGSLLPNVIQDSNDLTSEFPLMPIGLTSTTSPYRGRHGSVYDLWQGVSNAQNGASYPAPATSTATPERTLIHHGCLVMPWCGSALVTR